MKSDITKFIAIRNSLLQERTQIEARLAQINRALGASGPAAPAAPVAAAPAAAPSGKRTFSAATKAKMRVAQKARWAKIKGAAPAPAAAPKQARRKMSAAGRANIVAAVKARWAKVNAAKAKAGK